MTERSHNYVGRSKFSQDQPGLPTDALLECLRCFRKVYLAAIEPAPAQAAWIPKQQHTRCSAWQVRLSCYSACLSDYSVLDGLAGTYYTGALSVVVL